MPLISSAFSYFLVEYARLFIGGVADLAESPIFHRPIFANGYDVYFGAYFRSDYLHARFAVQATGIFLVRRFAS